ncbi:MAG TPA: hypothetical protein VGF16_03825 [Bryobacteraceae bacterium]|jgi:two-component SAPR family response regulator
MIEHRGSVLIVDRDIAFLLVMAQELARKGISLIPSTSVREARSMLQKLNPSIDILIINCGLTGVCALASEMRRRASALDVVAIVSANRQCSACRRLLTFVSRDPEHPEPPVIQKWGRLIDNWLAAKRKIAVVPERPVKN